MKQNKLAHSLKWRIYSFIISFVVLIVVILVLFQIVLLEPFYREIKLREIQNHSDSAVEVLQSYSEDKEIKDFIELNQKNNIESGLINAFVIRQYNNDLVLINSTYNDLSFGFIPDYFNVSSIWTKAIIEGYDSFFFNISDIENFDFHVPEDIRFNLGDELIYCQFYNDIDGNKNMLMLTSHLEPLTAAKTTLQYQLILIFIILTLLSILLAFAVSSYVCKPLEDLTKSAKRLPVDRNELSFSGEGYQEVIDLSNTLNYALNEIKKTDNLQKDLISNVSHELRTPLTLINGYAELMRDIPSEQNEKNFNIIINETKRLSTLVDDILTLSKLQSKNTNDKWDNFSINGLIDEVLLTFNVISSEKNFKFTFNPNHIYYISANEMQISQVMYNFIANAVNYNKKTDDEKEIIISIEEKENDLLIKVKDFGIGIKDEELENIWLSYYKVYDINKHYTLGSGLGLPIVKQILDSHKFEYGVNSKYNEGSEFYFVIPKENIIKKIQEEEENEETK